MMARYGMLECGQNYKGTMSENCRECEVKDNEEHRLNYYRKWKDINFYNSHDKISFSNIYCKESEKLNEILS